MAIFITVHHPDMNETIKYDYRAFQQIWDPNRIDGRTREACTRCRDKRAKCDGRNPCRRCKNVGAECLYMKPRIFTGKETEPREPKLASELFHEIQHIERALEQLESEMEQARAHKSVAPAASGTRMLENFYPSPPHSDEEDEDNQHETDGEAESKLVRGHYATTEKNSWSITFDKNRVKIQTDIQNIHQLYELFTSAYNLYRGPTTASRPVGTHAITLRLNCQWPKLHESQRVQFIRPVSSHPPNPQIDYSILAITLEIELHWLNLILKQATQCSPSARNKFCERFQVYYYSNQRPQSSHYMAVLYAVAALHAQHVISHHIDIAKAIAFPHGVSADEFARELSKLYFQKAQELVIDTIFDKSDSLCADTVDALHAMIGYLVSEGKANKASAYICITLRVATQLNFHKALRDSNKTDVEVEEYENAITWNLLACSDQALTAMYGAPRHTTPTDTQLNLLGITIKFPTEMPEETRQRIHESFFMARLSAISRDILDTFWGDSVADPAVDDIERFAMAFARWEDELPPFLHATGHPFSSLTSFFLTVNLHLVYQISLLDLYYPFLPGIHPNPESLPSDAPKQAERAYGDAAIMAVRLGCSYVLAGGCAFPPQACTFPVNLFPMACNAHMWLAEKSKDKEIRDRHRKYVAFSFKVITETREYKMQRQFFEGYGKIVKAFMKNEGIDLNEDSMLDEIECIVPERAPGVGW
ncbi:hypothetical protein BC937DRAFT_92359 [Endogone sp. FLAS-F59071]|nr:hypothetical protein BC937DRAFT_92359 [Endogone sp. FLAS-F59071]|eukprot:RUS15514.1 hypothetical protein BC937DRAFT_92359 [Endogone sp. FLAS-F59071]